ncbi:MAG: hypothetical protein GSR79_07035 [Desulfurococcales archaeon]|nr:hypothetical protein [Desulfurococcales archaeon]
MLPYEKKFTEFLCKQGICDLLISTYPGIPNERIVQQAFLDLMINKKEICYSRKEMPSTKIASLYCSKCINGVSFYVRGGACTTNHFLGYCMEEPLVSHSIIRKNLLSNPVYPLFVLDLSLLNFFGTKNEFEEAVLVIAHALQIIRKYLYDRNLLLTSTNEALIEELNRIVFDHDMIVSDKTSADVLWTTEIEEAVLVSPLAKKPLLKEELKNAQGIIIPLVFYWDRRMEKYITNLVPWAKVRRLELHGNIIGVPHKPTSVLEIILDVLYNNLDIETAVIKNMDRKNLFHRLRYEINRMASKGTDSLEELLSSVSWLVSDDVLVKRMLKDLIFSDREEKQSHTKNFSGKSIR